VEEKLEGATGNPETEEKLKWDEMGGDIERVWER
jgi:hypothetical protein